jgi:hypothetical protein
MKDNALLIIGLGALAFFMLSKKADSTGDGQASYFTYGTTNNYITNPVSGTKFGTNVLDAQNPSIDLSPVSFQDSNRFVGVTYDKGATVGVLDRAQQQSIEVPEAVKRANNPFIQALASPTVKVIPNVKMSQSLMSIAKPSIFA